jgi:hypothetical protein
MRWPCRVPQQLVLLPVIWVSLAGLNRLRLPRWGLALVTALLALGCEFAYQVNLLPGLYGILPIILAISAPLLSAAVGVGRIAARGASRGDGDVGMAIFASYANGQYMPLFY